MTTAIKPAIRTFKAVSTAHKVVVKPGFVQRFAPIAIAVALMDIYALPVYAQEFSDDKIDRVVIMEEKEIPNMILEASTYEKEVSSAVINLLDEIEQELVQIHETNDYSLVDTIQVELDTVKSIITP